MRLGFSIAVHVRADVLLLDEVFAVGDEAFQRKCVDRILEFSRQGGTLCFVSHAASAIEHLCDRAVLLQQGRVEYDGETEEALRRYHALLAARGEPRRRSDSSCASRARVSCASPGSQSRAPTAWHATASSPGSQSQSGCCSRRTRRFQPLGSRSSYAI